MSEKPLWWADAEIELDTIVEGFTDQLRGKLQELCQDPAHVIARKNPFLFGVRGANTPKLFADSCVSAFLSSSEETRFGAVFEKCAETIGKYGRGAQKSGIEGVDIEWNDKDVRVLAQIKSSINWGNSSQKKQMRRNFSRAIRILQQGTHVSVRCLECCSYGKGRHDRYGTHERIVGPVFWEELSMWSGTYIALFNCIEKHADNGLQSDKLDASNHIIEFLEEHGIIRDSFIDWSKFLTLIHAS